MDIEQTVDLIRKENKKIENDGYWKNRRFECENYKGRRQEIRLYSKGNGDLT